MDYSINGIGTTGWPSGRKIKLDPHPLSKTKINSRWIKDLNAGGGGKVKVVKENMRELLYNPIERGLSKEAMKCMKERFF